MEIGDAKFKKNTAFESALNLET